MIIAGQLLTLVGAILLLSVGLEWIKSFADLMFMWFLRQRLVLWTSLVVYVAVTIVIANASTFIVGATTAAIMTPIVVRRLADWIAWRADAKSRPDDVKVGNYIFKAARTERQRLYIAPPIIVDDEN